MRQACLLALVALAAPVGAHAETGVAKELHGVRSLAMGGAHRGVGTSNDALYLNPAGMAIVRRYAVELQYGYSPFDGLSHINVSALDSNSGPVAGAVAYTHVRGDKGGANASLHRLVLGAGYLLSDGLAFGMTTRHIRGHYNGADGAKRDVSIYSGDVGLMALISQSIGIGLTYSNVIPTKDRSLAPPSLGGGLSFMSEMLTVAADVTWAMDEPKQSLLTYHAGVEYLAGGEFPLRVGYQGEPFWRRDGRKAWENQVTAGAGWMSQQAGFDVGYRHSIERSRNWSLIGAFKLFI